MGWLVSRDQLKDAMLGELMIAVATFFLFLAVKTWQATLHGVCCRQLNQTHRLPKLICVASLSVLICVASLSVLICVSSPSVLVFHGSQPSASLLQMM